MTGSSFWRQFAALMKRNFYIKKRNKNSTIQEYLLPIYFVLLLGLIRMSISPRVEEEVTSFPEYRLNDVSSVPYSHVFITPDTTFTRSFYENLTSELPSTFSGVTYFRSQDELEEYYKENSTAHMNAVLGIDFGDVSSGGVDYKLRFSGTSVPRINLDDLYGSQGSCRQTDHLDDNCAANKYLISGFARLQIVCDTLLTRYLTNSSRYPVPDVSVQLMPKSDWISSTTAFQMFSSIYFVIAYSVFVSFMLVAIVTEKERRIKDGMQLMGLRISALWLSWGVTYAIIITKVTVIITILAWIIKLYHHSNMVFLFLQLLLYGFSIITFSFALTPFFHKAELAGSVGSCVTLLFSLAYLGVALTRTGHMGPEGPTSKVPSWAQWMLSLISPIALALGIDQGLYLDVSQGGMHTHNLWYGQFPIAGSLIMLAVDFFLYGVLALYLDSVIPDEYGQRRPLDFCFHKTFWCPRMKSDEEMTHLVSDVAMEIDCQDQEQAEVQDHMEPVAAELRRKNVIRICNLSKSFLGKKKKVINAVDNLTLDLYEGQITAILGHNGAGKTTLINILTGMSPASGGKAFIHNMNVSDSENRGHISRMMGVCPQHDILVNDLTCSEHLKLFAAIKNVPHDRVNMTVDSLLEDVDLSKKKNVLAGKLSGGQRRKLSLAMALIGDPKILLLDEPTAGLDPLSRRQVWTLLKDRSKNRVVLLTTHFMDEADILADRKAFMSRGRLRCVGSSLFLKNRFGLGYHVGLVLNVGSDQEAITQLVQRHIPQCTIHRASGHELTYTVPLSERSQFPALLNALEIAISEDQQGIRTYGVSMTTLEEVFMKIGIEEEAVEESDDDIHVPLLSGHHGYQAMGIADAVGNHDSLQVMMIDPEDEVGEIKVGRELTLQQFLALVKVKFTYLRRNVSALVFRIIMPVIFILIGVCLYKFSSPFKGEAQPFKFSPSHYLKTTATPENPHYVYMLSGQAVNQNWQELMKSIEAAGISTEFVSNTSKFLQVQPHHLGVNIYDLDTNKVTVLYNDTATHSLPVALNILSNAFLSMAMGNTSAPAVITVFSFPWPDLASISASFSNMGAAILLGMAPISIPASLAMLLVQERQKKIRNQLRLSGVSHSVYWTSTFFTDILQLLFIAVCSLLIIVIFKVDSLVTSGALLCLSLMYLMYFPLTLLLAYVVSFAFNKFETAQNFMFNIFTLSAVLPYVLVSSLDVNLMTNVATGLHYMFCCIDPPYVFIGSIYYINKIYISWVLTHGLDAPLPISEYFHWSNNITIIYIPPIISIFTLLYVIRYIEHYDEASSKRSSKITKHSAMQGEDSDVEEERSRIDSLMAEQPRDRTRPAVTVHNLRKAYITKPKTCSLRKDKKVKVAVHNVSFCVEEKEVFGLLGPNGAGKTTTMNMVTAEVSPSSGQVVIGSKDGNGTYGHLGYCPQHDALYNDITQREHLDLYLSLRGYKKCTRQAIINYYGNALQLNDHMDKHGKKLSGGTKRKLSYAIAMVGRPRIVLLDEPSTGLDPKSKHHLWDTIRQTFSRGDRGAILTTHYMEEADALCHRVAIMINGQLVCIGPTQHLKNKYGSGYILEVKLKSYQSMSSDSTEQTEQTQPEIDRSERLHKFVTELMPGVARVEHFLERATYRIPSEISICVADIFKSLEECKVELEIEDYSFSQATLEQVFLEFAKKQLDGGHHDLIDLDNITVRTNTTNIAQDSTV